MVAKRMLTLFFFLIIMTSLRAQQDTTGLAQQVDTIAYKKQGEKYYQNGMKLKYDELKFILNQFQSSAQEYKLYSKMATPGTIIILTGLTSAVIAFTRINMDTHFFTPYTITLFSADLIGVPLMIWANKHLRKSVLLYNQEIRK